MKMINRILMKRCPKCHIYNKSAEPKCTGCGYEFKNKKKLTRKSNNDETEDEWPSDEWKDWNTM